MRCPGKETPFLILPILLWLSGASYLPALEAEGSFRIGNLAFSETREPADTGFSGTDYPWGFSLGLSHDVAEQLQLQTVFSNDDVLRYISETRIVYTSPFLSAGIGPIFGILNSGAMPVRPGVTASVLFSWPETISLSLRGDTSLGSDLSDSGDYRQELGEIALGFQVPGAECSIRMLTRRYLERTADGKEIDTWTEYSFRSRIRKADVPYEVLLSFGYQDRSRTFEDLNRNRTVHGLGTFALGTGVEAGLPKGGAIFVNLESSLYTFGYGELLGVSNPGPGGFLFRLETGVRISLDPLP